MKLTTKAVQAAKFTGRPVKLYDGHGLHLYITATARTWRYGYKLHGRQGTFTIGPADVITLAQARDRHRAARLLVMDGKDPVADRQAETVRRRAAGSVDQLLEDWLGRTKRAAPNESKIRSRIAHHLSPRFMRSNVAAVTPDHVLAELKRAETDVSADLAHRLRSYLRAAFDDALADDKIAANPARHPKIAMRIKPANAQTPYPHITDVAVLADVLARIEGYIGHRSVQAALWLSPRLALRPGELRSMAWSEIELENARAIIPAARVKGRRDHIVPLARQCVAVLRALGPSDGLVFPSPRSRTKPISDMALSSAMSRLGVQRETITAHGWRHTFSTFANERDFGGVRARPDVIEMQLSHTIKGVRGVYNRAQYLPERERLMQAYADWMDELVKPPQPSGSPSTRPPRQPST